MAVVRLPFSAAIVASLALVLCLPSPQGSLATSLKPPSLSDEVRELVHQHFYKPERVGTFDTVLQNALSSKGIDRAIDLALDSLGASHTARYTPDTLEY